jgi:hypothetical protein
MLGWSSFDKSVISSKIVFFSASDIPLVEMYFAALTLP